MAVTRLHIANMILLALAGLVILALSLATANSLTTSNTSLGWRLYFGREILPDNVLYPLFMIQDRWKMENASSEEQLTLKLQYSEDRLRVATELEKQNQIVLAVSTLTKSQKYLLSAGYQLLESDSTSVDELKHFHSHLAEYQTMIEGFTQRHQGVDLSAVHLLKEDARILHKKLEERISQHNPQQ